MIFRTNFLTCREFPGAHVWLPEGTWMVPSVFFNHCHWVCWFRHPKMLGFSHFFGWFLEFIENSHWSSPLVAISFHENHHENCHENHHENHHWCLIYPKPQGFSTSQPPFVYQRVGFVSFSGPTSRLIGGTPRSRLLVQWQDHTTLGLCFGGIRRCWEWKIHTYLICLKIVYPYTQWLMIIIPIEWL